MDQNIKIGIIGLGYVGLPLAVELAKNFQVNGFDINNKRIEDLAKNIDSTNEVSSKDLENSLNLTFTNYAQDLENCNFYIVTVPTPIDDFKVPDLTPLIRASESVSMMLKKDDIVVFESTVYPGATEEVCVPILEKGSGLKFNLDFSVAYSPERINPADKSKSLRDIVKVVSSSTEKSLQIVCNVYSKIIDAGIHVAESIRVAEAAKVIENTQRDINIALVNEFAQIFDKLGLDTSRILAAARTKWNFLDFHPGLVGGHCIGVDPYYLTHKAKQTGHNPELVLAGRNVNDKFHEFLGNKFVKAFFNQVGRENSDILVLGVTFKPNCPDIRNSRVFNLIDYLNSFKLNISVYDPLINIEDLPADFANLCVTKIDCDRYSAVILAVAHEQFLHQDFIEFYEKTNSKGGLIFDIYSKLDKKYLSL